jgi:hypothetical protein
LDTENQPYAINHPKKTAFGIGSYPRLAHALHRPSVAISTILENGRDDTTPAILVEASVPSFFIDIYFLYQPIFGGA